MAPANYSPGDYLVEGRKTCAYDLERFEKRNIIIGLRRQGLTYAQIQAELKLYDPPIEMTVQSIAKTVQRHLRELSDTDRDTVDDLRMLENERLDALWQAYFTAAVGDPNNPDPELRRPPNLKAAAFLLNLSARRAKMNGLDAAQKVEHLGKIEHLHDLNVDPDQIRDARDAFIETYSKPGIEPPDIIDSTAAELPESVEA